MRVRTSRQPNPRFIALSNQEMMGMHTHINSKFVFHRDGDGVGVRPLYRFLTQIERELIVRNIPNAMTDGE
jgi:hypothetical protein